MKTKSKIISDSSGFTLMELLVVIVTIGALIATSVPTYHEFMTLAYRASQIVAVRNMMESLEVGIAEIEEDSPNGIFEEFTGLTGYSGMYSGRLHPGPVLGNSGGWHPYVDQLLPGYVSPNNQITGVSWEPTCTVAGCFRYSAYSLHCKTRQHYVYTVNGKGKITSYFYANPEDCLGNTVP